MASTAGGFDIFYLFDTCKEFKSIYFKCRWTGNGCTMLTDVRKNSLMACIIFLSVAEANKQNGFMCCLCVNCKNNKDYSSSRILHSHIFANGFMKKDVCWTKHGEQGVTMEDNEEEDFDDQFPGNAGFVAFDDDILMEEPEVDVAEDGPSDDLGQALQMCGHTVRVKRRG